MAASRTLNVSITGDSRDLQRAMGQAGKSTAAFEKKASATSKATGMAFRTLAGVAGIGAVAAGLRSTIQAAQESEKSQSRLNAQLKTLGTSYRAHAKEIDLVIQKTSRLSGLDDEDLQDAFTAVVRSTGNVKVALHDMALVADLARAKHMDVAKAGELVAKVHAGSVGPLKRLGIQFTATTNAVDNLKATTKKYTPEQLKAAQATDKQINVTRALGLLHHKVSGQAEAYGKTAAGAQDRFRNAVENLQEKLGGALLPTLTKVSSRAAKFVDEMTNGVGAGGRFAAKMKEVFQRVGDVVGVLRDGAKWLGKHPGLLKAAAAAWVAYKAAALTQIAIVKAAELGLFGGPMKAKLASDAAKTGTTVGRGFAVKAGAAAAAGVAGWQIGKWLRSKSPEVKSAGDFIGKQLGEAIFGGSDLQDRVNKALDLRDRLEADTKANPKSPGHGGRKSPAIVVKKPKAASASLPHLKKQKRAVLVAHAAGEAGGSELGSIQRAAAWVHANYPGVGTLIEDAGGGNQHLHVEGPVSTVVAIGRKLQAAGFSVGENPSFGGVHPVHSHGGLAGIPGDHYTGNAIDVNADFRSLSISGGGSAGSTKGTTTTAATKKKSAPPKVPVFRVPDVKDSKWEIWDSEMYYASKFKPDQLKSVKHQRDTTIDNPLLQAALTHIDNRVAAGELSEAEGNSLKTTILTKALPQLTGDNALIAKGMIRSLAPAAADSGSFYDQVESGLSHIDAQVRAGDLTPEQGRLAKVDLINGNLGNPGLSGDDVLNLRGELNDLTKDNTEATSNLADEIKALRESVEAQTKFATSVAATEAGAMARWVQSVLSTGLGVSVAGRGLTPSYGVARRS